MNRENDITREERELLTLLRARPGVYLGNETGLTAFVKFIKGYEVALRRHMLHDVCIVPEGFQAFVENYYFVRHDSPMGWWTLILQRQPDEYAAMELFWDLLNEYLTGEDCEPIPEPPQRPDPPGLPDGISRIRHTDLPRLAESYMRTFNGEPWWDRWDRTAAVTRLQDMYRTPGSCGLALWKDGSVLGGILGRSEHYFDGDCFQIIELWVEPRAQKQGWGKKLLDELTAILKSRNICRLYLITMRGEATEGFYQKCGFTTQEGMCVMQLP